MKRARPYLTLYALTAATVVAVWFIGQLGFLQSANQLLIDQLHGLPASAQVVIVGIDDKSLQEIGAWEWSRDIFAQALDRISEAQPSVIGVDVLFLEQRSGDTELLNALVNSSAPVVLGNKLLDANGLLDPVFSGAENVSAGFINFTNDPDGKIRSTLVSLQVGAECIPGFSWQVLRAHLRMSGNVDCLDRNAALRNHSFALDESRKLSFGYARERFTQISFSDAYSNNFDPEQLKNKIVLIGATALDVRSGLNDNFVNIFGATIPGVEVHANVINSLLQGVSYVELDPVLTLLGFLTLNVLLVSLYQVLQRRWLDTILMVSAAAAAFLLGAFIFGLGILWPFLFGTLSIISTFAVYVLYNFYHKRRESEFVRKAFSQYVNPAILQELLTSPESLKLGGDSRVMTVLFSDLRGFTSLSETMSAEELIRLLNDYLDRMSKVIISHNGTIDKYIGDAIMALWNAPLNNANHADDSVATALAMTEALKQFNAEGTYPEVKIGIGINTGEMVVGNVGGSQRFDYTVLGDNVNLASRLEGLTKKYGVEIIVTEATKDACLAPEKFTWRLLDEVQVKGKTQAVKLFEPMVQSEENEKLAKTYTEAFGLYQVGDFKTAKQLLRAEMLAADKPSQLLAARNDEFIKTPPSDWHGVWKWEEK